MSQKVSYRSVLIIVLPAGVELHGPGAPSASKTLEADIILRELNSHRGYYTVLKNQFISKVVPALVYSADEVANLIFKPSVLER